jgi:hypothetical protein
VTSPDGSYRVLASDDGTGWPDGFSFGPDGHLYVAVSQLHRSAVFNAGEEASQPPFEVMRLGPSSCPYSPECVEGAFPELAVRAFSEVRRGSSER